ncbi:MAG: hypothetical protein JJU32_11065 [Phormidium sp. BM_Day4_Bin.17]|nr:hypothetical protein [Phormidium sp. BM_Day4_Bin.17]UCJ13014.1 MAG: hypothetical protein JWS08_04255 [Phormidium sp. PBR-2020]
MEYIELENGVKIPVYTREESLTPVYESFGLSYNDSQIVVKAIEYIKQLQRQKNTPRELQMEVLTFLDLWAAVAGHMESMHYYDWICTYSQFFLYAMQNAYDLVEGHVKYLLLGEQLLEEIISVVPGSNVVSQIFDGQGLDFFLSYYFCGEVKEEVLLEYSGDRLCRAMKKIGRPEEAEKISLEIKNRANGLRNARHDGVLDDLRLEGERAWFQYLGVDNWQMLSDEARIELVDAYSIQRMIEYRVLKIWAPVVLAITKVVESELNHILIKPWRDIFASAEFQAPAVSSKKQEKKLARRKQLFTSIKKAATTGPELTLGQLQVLVNNFDDDLMDNCTDAFIRIRSVLDTLFPEFQQLLTHIENCFLARDSEMGIVDLRNASAHPRPDSVNIDWRSSALWLRQLLGTPPLELLTNVRMLKQLSNIALERQNQQS